jgi:iron-sulfur cluster assembly accessory protein
MQRLLYQQPLLRAGAGAGARRLMATAGKVVLAPKRRLVPAKAAIEITDSAAARLQALVAQQAGALGVRLGIKTRGCNGVSYTMTYATAAEKFDEEVADKGVRVFIEPRALLKITGTVMDYKEDEVSAEFTFTNPLATSVCGCGESFST